METVNQIDQIQNKLRKLIKLQESAIKVGNENEATAAAAAIQRLLLSYNLSIDELDLKDKPKAGVEENMDSWYKYKFIGGDWEFRLMYVCCKWNFCKCFIHGDRKDRRMLILGLPQNMETVKWLHTMLCERFVELGKLKYKLYQDTIDFKFKPIGLDTYLRHYLGGCVSGLDVKFQEEANADKSQDAIFAGKVTALVLRNDAAIDEFVATKYKMNKGRQTNVKVNNIFMHGVKDGKNTSINKAVKESKDDQINKIKMLK